MKKKPHVCFVSEKLYNYYSNSDEPAGGAQRQQYLLGKGLLKKGYQVTALVGDYGQPRTITREGVDIVKGCPGPVKSMKDIPTNILSLFLGIKRVDADIYYIRGAPPLFTITQILCELIGKSTVYCIANDRDVDPERLSNSKKIEYNSALLKLYDQAIKRSDLRIAQTIRQKNMMENNYKSESIVIPNGYTLPKKKDILPHSSRDFVLWVGTSDYEQKRPDRLLEIARQLPNIDFVMICRNKSSDEYYASLSKKALKIDNLTFVESVPPEEIHEYFRKASLLVCTSDYEGFPNTFLEAWRYETPVVSSHFRLDNNFEDIGIVSGNIDSFIEDIKRIYEDIRYREKLGKKSRNYLNENYHISKVLRMYDQEIKSISATN
ncbi:glycosyltransferase family 4 protein [Natronorarus salvus]|uniref:glycosyltransferase family 4 protein n=1 Tax=Natronorarus salvus TaxID=3117733 RepID=UPI002F26BF4F